MNPNIAQQAKDQLAALPRDREEALRTEWRKACAAIETHMLARRPKPRSFEVHHVIETARKAFLSAFVRGEALATLVDTALTAAGVAP